MSNYNCRMRLYGGVWSGYTQKVRIALAEKGLASHIPVEIVPIDEKGSPVHRERNPLGLVPVLELDDGSYIPESTVIIEYLEALYPHPPLLPNDPALRARMHVFDRYNDQALTPPVRTYWAAPGGAPPPTAAGASISGSSRLQVSNERTPSRSLR